MPEKVDEGEGIGAMEKNSNEESNKKKPKKGKKVKVGLWQKVAPTKMGPPSPTSMTLQDIKPKNAHLTYGGRMAAINHPWKSKL